MEFRMVQEPSKNRKPGPLAPRFHEPNPQPEPTEVLRTIPQKPKLEPYLRVPTVLNTHNLQGPFPKRIAQNENQNHLNHSTPKL